MMDIPCCFLQLAFDLKEGGPLTEEQRAVCEEWTSGNGIENMKVDIGNPRLLEFAALYDACERKKEAKWKSIEPLMYL